MKRKTGLKTSWLGLAVAFLFFWVLPLFAQNEPIAIIVNKANPSNSLNQSTVASIYRGEELHWGHGGRIKLVNREISSSLRRRFYREVLNAKPDQTFYRAGTPVAIQSLIQRSDEAVLRFVVRIEGAIGYVKLSKADDSVKVLMLVK